MFSVSALTIVCTDQDRSAAFYGTVLGGTPLPVDVGGLPPWFRFGNFDVTLVANASKTSEAGFGEQAHTMLWLEVDDIGAAHRHLLANKVRILEYDEVQYLLCTDPDGLQIELWQRETTG
jgi:catechol 2,3-dioxygenase-like lactoylglutathione lyase family enzyme